MIVVPLALEHSCINEIATLELAAKLAPLWKAGDIVALSGELGAGKTTFVRGVLRALGYSELVRSPTFNLLQEFPTTPPILHADLYRVAKATGLGLEDYFSTHLMLVEWPDRLADLLDLDLCWRLDFEFEGEGRKITMRQPLA